MQEALIAGGGPAGAAAAIVLARAGWRVRVIEREGSPREKVCGEFLGADAAALLAALGLDVAALGAVPIAGAQVARGAGAAALDLPFAAWGLPRRVLDEALLAVAAAAGAEVLRGQAVREAACADAAWQLRLSDGAVVCASQLILATGKHELRGFPRTAQEGSVGAKLHLRLRAPLAAVTLLPFAGGYAGLQPGPGGIANLCAALSPARAGLAREAGSFVALVAAGSALGAALLEGAQPLMPRPLAVARVPYGFLHRDAAAAEPGLWRVGDQFAVIPSFCGDGMAMALAGGMAAAGAILAGEGAPAFHARWRARLRPAMALAGASSFVLRRAPRVFAGVVAFAPPLARLVARRTRVAGPPLSA
ncbi:MAG TPA: FAD-dependent monooxygenase [Acetobacteraceae bacterium]|nr:FAD-dependent monooxygenase [Acetobacteraceae bacterium]